ncbi:MAG: VOC family protein [Acidimicrobiales bacterium]|nr:VOC family protein [Acidimicrobiales bacterium]
MLGVAEVRARRTAERAPEGGPERARRFYETTFGWAFEPWGPPGFYKVADDGPVLGALQQRRALGDAGPAQGFECTVAVDDVAATISAATDAGGRVLMEPTVIDGVGELAFVADTEGHAVGLMRYENGG